MLSIENLTVGYGQRALLNEVSATLGAGELVTLVGANGAGKSTLLKVLSGDLRPLSGMVSVEGESIAGLSRQRLSRLISVVNTDRVEADALTVREVVSMGRYPYTGFFGRLADDDEAVVGDAMAATGVERFAWRNVATLSDGERQKVMIARALAQATPVILLDEPTAFLDVASRVEVLSLLASLAHERGKAVLLSSHDLPAALDLSDRLWLLPGDGTLVCDTPAALIAAHNRAVEKECGFDNGCDSPLDRLFPGRHVRFDARRLDFVAIAK